MVEIVWERKKKKRKKKKGNGATTHCPEHHQPIPRQCKEGGPTVKGFIEGVVWWRGKRAYFRFLARAFFEEMLC